MASICVFTPTYNRKYTLERLYESLKRQSFRDFRWLVVDDGSSDGTDELIASFSSEEAIPIEYVYVSNGGKQRAHDLAVSMCDDELFFVVDSDDYLVDNALQLIVERWARVRGKDNVAGLLGLMGEDTSTPLGTRMPKDVSFSTQWDLYGSGFKGDISLIYRTDVLKKFPFDVDPDEKFIPETYVYYRIDQHYTCALIDEILTIAKYLPDGYSHSFPKNVIANPKCYYRHKKLCMEMSKGLKQLFYNTVLYLVACRLCSRNDGIRNSRNKPVAFAAYPVALFLLFTVFNTKSKL